MKIIQVTGRSNSGKTTVIRNLIPELKKIGAVGVIKHLGDHEFVVETEKDTTFFYEAGADITTGTDTKKTVIIEHSTDLDEVLRFYADRGMYFAVIEGYKQRSDSKIGMGDLEIDRGVLYNPTINEVMKSLNLFDDFK